MTIPTKPSTSANDADGGTGHHPSEAIEQSEIEGIGPGPQDADANNDDGYDIHDEIIAALDVMEPPSGFCVALAVFIVAAWDLYMFTGLAVAQFLAAFGERFRSRGPPPSPAAQHSHAPTVEIGQRLGYREPSAQSVRDAWALVMAYIEDRLPAAAAASVPALVPAHGPTVVRAPNVDIEPAGEAVVPNPAIAPPAYAPANEPVAAPVDAPPELQPFVVFINNHGEEPLGPIYGPVPHVTTFEAVTYDEQVALRAFFEGIGYHMAALPLPGQPQNAPGMRVYVVCVGHRPGIYDNS